jgi:hypothetical protein
MGGMSFVFLFYPVSVRIGLKMLKLSEKKKKIEYVDEQLLKREYERIKDKFENVMICVGENDCYEIWVGRDKAIEVMKTLDDEILKIDYFGEKILVRK